MGFSLMIFFTNEDDGECEDGEGEDQDGEDGDDGNTYFGQN